VHSGHGHAPVHQVEHAGQRPRRLPPDGVAGRYSALRTHNIGTQAPHEVWLALDRKARKPSRPPARLRIVRLVKAGLVVLTTLALVYAVFLYWESNRAKTVVMAQRQILEVQQQKLDEIAALSNALL
jgi:hypothetical protein